MVGWFLTFLTKGVYTFKVKSNRVDITAKLLKCSLLIFSNYRIAFSVSKIKVISKSLMVVGKHYPFLKTRDCGVTKCFSQYSHCRTRQKKNNREVYRWLCKICKFATVNNQSHGKKRSHSVKIMSED